MLQRGKAVRFTASDRDLYFVSDGRQSDWPNREKRMTYATNRLYCDADSHIMETVDWIEKHADPESRARLPQLSLVKSATATFDFIHEAVEKQKTRAQKGKVHT